MAVRIGSNISSLQAQRRLSDSSSTLSKTYERLSSGQRINRASDDAAGLSIADSLGVGRRVFTQGARNLNDGISALQIADSAVSNLSQVVTRIRELAEQAANGSYSATQRKAMDKEAQALQKEYFRISRSSEFNGTSLFDGSLSNGLRLQGGFGVEGSIQSSLGGVMGDGTFSAKTFLSSGGAFVTLGDLNGDGALDMVSLIPNGNTANVLMGNGDGTFSAIASYASGSTPMSVTLGDINGDGVLDMVTADRGTSTASVFIGKGDGSFYARTALQAGATPSSVTLGDMNGDGVLDIVTAEYFDSTLSVFIGKGDGSFHARTTFQTGVNPFSVTLGDLNGDGVQDMISADYNDYNDGTVSVFIGKGDGTFYTRTSVQMGSNVQAVALGDLNADGVLDMLVGLSGAASNVLIGKGDGSFYAGPTVQNGMGMNGATLRDLNGDGLLDLVTGGAGYTAGVYVGKGDGGFYARTDFQAGDNPTSIALGDLNLDGVLDLVTANSADDTASVLLGNTREGIAPLLPFSLTTQADALQAMAPLDRKLSQLAAQRGVIGAFQSRLSVAINTLQSMGENYAAAESRIRDADIASEAAELKRLQISQQAATAVLAQANQQPALAISLLRS